MTLKFALSTATAMGLLMGTAVAGSNNQAYVGHDGTQNEANLVQSGSNNQIGKNASLLGRTNQEGKFNIMTVTQSGNGNKAGVAGSNNLGIDQKARDNTLTIVQSGDSNTITDVTQYGRATGGAAANIDGAQVNTATFTQLSSATGSTT